MEQQTKTDEAREYPYWNRVYGAVIVYTIILIIGLWAFSKAFQ
jgi:hypothetical protein